MVEVGETELKKAIINVIGANELEVGFCLEGINGKPNGKEIGNCGNQEQTINTFWLL